MIQGVLQLQNADSNPRLPCEEAVDPIGFRWRKSGDGVLTLAPSQEFYLRLRRDVSSERAQNQTKKPVTNTATEPLCPSSTTKDQQAIDAPPELPKSRHKKPRERLRRSEQFLAVILFIVVMTTLYLARGFFLPVFAALLLSYALLPGVRFLVRFRIPRVIAAFFIVLVFSAGIVALITELSRPAMEWLSRAPEAFERLEEVASLVRRPMQSVNEASEKLSKMTQADTKENTVVRVEDGNAVDVILAQTPIVLGAFVTTLVLLFFILAYGDLLLRRFVEIYPRLRDKRRALETARQIERNVSHYLVTITLINITLGILVGSSLALLGLDNPLLWGSIAALFNFVPYVGAILGVALVALASIISVEPLSQSLIYPLIYLTLTVLEGNFVTPMILGRSFSINPIFIILALLLMGWLWAIPGAVMAVPLLIAFKCYAEQVSALRPYAGVLNR